MKELRQQEAWIAEHAERNYEHFVVAWQPRPPKNSGGYAAPSNRQGLNRLTSDASSRHWVFAARWSGWAKVVAMKAETDRRLFLSGWARALRWK